MRNGMTSERWQQIRNIRPQSRMAFVSNQVAMLPEPWNPSGPRTLPWIGPGTTMNLGRNRAKRSMRILPRKQWHVLPRHRFTEE